MGSDPQGYESRKTISKADVAEVMDQVILEIQSLREAGQKEYAHRDEDAMRNFITQGKRYNLPPEKVLMLMADKHHDGIVAFINGHRSQRESVTGRINDMIVYLILLRAMIDMWDLEEAR